MNGQDLMCACPINMCLDWRVMCESVEVRVGCSATLHNYDLEGLGGPSFLAIQKKKKNVEITLRIKVLFSFTNVF